MTTTPPEAPSPGPTHQDGPRVGWDEIRDLGRLRRDMGDRRVAGVASGLARHLDVDPLILRVAFVVLALFGGAGVLLYVACWLLVPAEGSDRGKVGLDRRSRVVALVGVGVVALAILFGHVWWDSSTPWVLALVAFVAVLVIGGRGPRGERDDHVAQDPAETAAPVGGASYVAPAADPTAYTYVRAPRPPNPRKRGPILFWFGLALMTVALGVLGIVDLAGAHVVPSAYPALVLAISGVLLLVGAFFGRAGGLILVGLLAAFGTAGATLGDHWHPDTVHETPLTAAAVVSDYHLDVGELDVDLSNVRDLQALDGRVVEVRGGIGHLDIHVPAGMRVVVDSRINGVGGMKILGRDAGGADTTLHVVHQGPVGAPTLTIDAHLHVGQIDLEAS